MVRVLNCLATEHDWRLVILAGVICLLGSIAAMSLLHRARTSAGRDRAHWSLAAGAVIGCGIWATHFIAMLAYQPGPVPAIAYSVGLTALSLLAAVALTSLGAGVAALMHRRLAAPLGGAIVGAGIACMHYLGMSAVEMPAQIIWRIDLIFASVVVGILLAAAALTLATRRDDLGGLLAAAAMLALAIVSHHFIAMGAVGIVPDPVRLTGTFALSPAALAVAIAGVAVAIVGIGAIIAVAGRRIATASELGRANQQLAEEADAKLHEEHVRLETALNNMSQGLCMFDADARLVICNGRYAEMYGLPAEMVKPGLPLDELLRWRAERGTFSRDPAEYIAELRATIANGRTASLRSELADGRVIVVVNQPMHGGGWVATHEDITEQRRAEQRIAYLAHHDTLTDLPNRAAFAERLGEMLERGRNEGGSFAVFCIDLDRFKEVNDVFGHSVGDALLKEAGRRLKGAAEGAFVARFGGDEFNLIVPDPAQPAASAAMAERLIGALADELEIDGHRLRIGLSIGVAIFPNDGADIATLLGNADAALYRAKADGRGNIRFFEAEMDMRLRQRRALQHELRGAVENGQLRIHYQPQARMDGEITGFEALARWEHPTRGLVAPGAFIPLAEESGLIISIGEWILREVCREAASWPRPLQIAINLSPVQFQHGDLPNMVHAVLLETGLAASRLELEITEGVLVGDFSRAVSILRRLKALGVRIAMDDFGTGYSSLSYLQSFPFDRIKIDRAFISNVERNVQSAAIVRAVIGLAHGLALPVVAEGVETKDQLAFLTGESCNEAQGFFIGLPRPIEDYAALIGRAPARRPRRAAAG